jgi:GntR family transcriptional regulator, transcriptional repressor for pyruvate dehydrogenase complex
LAGLMPAQRPERRFHSMSNSSTENRPRDSLTAQVLRALVASIDTGELQPGDRLPPERELTARYSVSRTVVREAIASLRSSGRIDTQQGRGAFVLAPPFQYPYAVDASDLSKIGDMLQIMDLRIGLESEGASLAAQRRTPAQLADIRSALDKLETGIKAAETAVSSDAQFHLEILRATGNSYYIDLFTQLGPLMIPRARVDLFKDDRRAKIRYLELIQAEHAQIYQAIARRDAEAARAAVRLHLTNSRERLRATLERTAAA